MHRARIVGDEPAAATSARPPAPADRSAIRSIIESTPESSAHDLIAGRRVGRAADRARSVTPSIGQRCPPARRNTPAASAWRRRTPRQAPARPAAPRRPIRRSVKHAAPPRRARRRARRCAARSDRWEIRARARAAGSTRPDAASRVGGPHASAAAAPAARGIPSVRGCRRATPTSAECIEFGSSSAVSKSPARELGANRSPAADAPDRRRTRAARSCRSTPGTSGNSGAIAARAATVIDAPGEARRTSAIAGSAMTASPSQLGARMTRRFIVCYGRKDRALRSVTTHEDRPAASEPDRRRPRRQRAPDSRGPPRARHRTAPISPRRRSWRWSAICRAICCSVPASCGGAGTSLEGLARDAADLPPVLVGLPEPNPSDRDGRSSTPPRCCAAAASTSASARRCCPPTTSSTRIATSSRFTARRCSTSAASGVGISICEDIWNDRDFWKRRRYHHDPIEELVRAGANVVVNLSASPFTAGKHRRREEMLSSMAPKHRVPIAYVNQFGGNDDLVFDGRSCMFNADGAVFARGRAFEADVVVCDIGRRAADRAGVGSGRRVGDLARAGPRHARLRAQVRLLVGGARPVRRHRLGADRGDRRRGARRRSACSAC